MAAGAKVREPKVRGSQRGKTGAGVAGGRKVAKGHEVDEVYLYGEDLDKVIGGKLIDWGLTAFGGRLWMRFEMPDGRIVAVYTDFSR